MIVVKSIPALIQMYKQIYNNYILKEEEIIQKTKQMIEADKNIKTTYIKPSNKVPNDLTKMKIKKQRQQVLARYKMKFEK